MKIDAEEWQRRSRAMTARIDHAAAHITEDRVPFSAAAETRNLLMLAEHHILTGAGALLDRAIEAVLPQRLRAVSERVEHAKTERGFHVQYVIGRGDPLPVPPFAYTAGLLERSGAPELAIVGIAPDLASEILNDLGGEVVAGKRTVNAGEDIIGVISGGYALRIIECPPALLEQLHLSSDIDRRAVQILVPDANGRFPGEPHVDPEYARLQHYPKHDA
jgi:hypothetical protein